MTSKETLIPDNTNNPVGASLLAKAPDQATSSLNDTPHSRAGSLPQDGVQPAKFTADKR